MGHDKGADEPGPDRALMVGPVALLLIATIAAFVIGVGGGQAAQAVGGQKLAGAHVDHAFLLCGGEGAVG